MTSDPAAAHEPPFVLDGTVTRAKLRELLEVQAELTWLDYKGECDIRDARGLVEIVKDVGALMIYGGYLVIGADETGIPVGLPREQAKLFDQATVSDKLARYLPSGFEIRCAVHDLNDNPARDPRLVAILWVAPHPDGWCIFTRNGEYPDGNRTKIVFRRGEVYARHGSRSEPWQQSDVTHARSRLVAREKDRWRSELAGELQLGYQGPPRQWVGCPCSSFG